MQIKNIYKTLNNQLLCKTIFYYISSKFAKEGILSKFKDKKFEVKEGKFGEEATKFIKELQESDKDAFKPLQSNNKGEDDTSQGTYHYEPGGSQGENPSELQSQINSILGL